MTWPCARVCRTLPFRAVLPPARSVSAKTRAKVERATADLGYSANILARSLMTGKTQLIGPVSNNFHKSVCLWRMRLAGRGAAATRQVQQPPATGWRGDQINAVGAIAFAVRHLAPITIRVIHRQYQGLAESAVSVWGYDPTHLPQR